MTREELEALGEEDLDEMVHDLKGEEAAAINNAGKEVQIAFILGEDETPDGLTPEQWAAYQAESGECPFCRSSNIEGGPMEFYSGPCQKIACLECGAEWDDVYILKTIDIQEMPMPQEEK